MNDAALAGAAVSDHGIGREDFLRAVLSGLGKQQKELPCRFFYDQRGSELFEDITRLSEYYPTRTEAAILEAHRDDLASLAGPGSVLVEFGSGSSTKTEILLEAMTRLRAYVAIDVSESALAEARERIAPRHQNLKVKTIVADFSEAMRLPPALAEAPLLGFFPGSTIGNLRRPEAGSLLRHFRTILGAGAKLLIGVDLKKDLATLLPAYNDASGVTAAFNLNLLTRINRELDADFDLGNFRHEAIWNPADGRIEMHLVSARAQKICVAGQPFSLAAGETIHTENSHKYGIEEFRTLAQASGWQPVAVWTDAQTLFSVHLLEAGPSDRALAG